MDEEKHIHDLAFLSMTAMGFLELSLEDNIYGFIAEQLKKLSGDFVFHGGLQRILGFNVVLFSGSLC